MDVFVGVPANAHKGTVVAIKAMGFVEQKRTFRSNQLCMLVTDKFKYDVAIQVVANNSEFEDFIRFRDILRANS